MAGVLFLKVHFVNLGLLYKDGETFQYFTNPAFLNKPPFGIISLAESMLEI